MVNRGKVMEKHGRILWKDYENELRENDCDNGYGLLDC